MFTKEGDFKVRITEVMLAEPKFASAGEGAFDVVLRLESVTDASEGDFWRGEVSANFGKGAFSDRTQAQLTMETLRKIGLQGDLDGLDALVGKETTAHVAATEKDGKTFYNVKYIGGSSQIKKIDMATAQARFRAITGSAGAAPALKTAPAAPAPAAAKTSVACPF